MDQKDYVWKKRTVLVSLTTTTTVVFCVIFINLFSSCESNSFLQVENERPVPTNTLLSFSPQLLDPSKLANAGNPDSSHEGLKPKHRKKSKHRNKTGHHKRKHHKKKKNKNHHGSRNSEQNIALPSTTPKLPVVVVQNPAVQSLDTLNLQDLVPKTATNEFSFPILNNPVEIVKPNIVQKTEQTEPVVVAQAPEPKKTIEKKQDKLSSQNQQQQQQQEQKQVQQQEHKEQPKLEQAEQQKQEEQKQQHVEQKQQQQLEQKQQKYEQKYEQKQQKHEQKQQQKFEQKQQKYEQKQQKYEQKQQKYEQKQKQQMEQKQPQEQQSEQPKVQSVPKDQPTRDAFGRSMGSSKSETPVKNHPSMSNQQEKEPKREEIVPRKPEIKPEPVEPKSKPIPIEIQKVEIKTTGRPEFWVRSDINVEDSEPENLLELNEEKRALKKKKIKKASKLGRGKSAGKKKGKAAAEAPGASSEAPPVVGSSEAPPVIGSSAAPPVIGSSEAPPDGGGASSVAPPVGGSSESPPNNKIVPWIDFPDLGDNGTGNGSRSGFDPSAKLPTQEEYDQKCRTADNMETKARCLRSQNQIEPEAVDAKSKNNVDVDILLNWYAVEGKRISGKYEDKPTYSVERQNRKLAITTIKNALDPAPETELEPLNGFKLLNTTKWIFETACPVNLVPPQFLDMIVTAFKRIYEQATRDRKPFLNDVEFGWVDNTLRTCVETVVPANYLQDTCKEEVYAVDANANLLCLGHMTNRNKQLQSTACFQTDLRTFDPVLDVVWLMFEAVKATCFESFQGNSRLLHRYSAAIMDLFPRPLKFRWPLESGGIKFWERILGPGVDLYLRNIDKCLHQIVQTSSLDFRTPRFYNTHTVRLSNTLTEFIDLP